MTFMTFITIMTHKNVTFESLEPIAEIEEPCEILKKLLPACVVNIIHAKALPGSVLYIFTYREW